MSSENWKALRWGDIATLEYGKSLKNYKDSKGKIPVYGTNGSIGFTDKPLCHYPSVIVGRKGAYRGVHFSKEPFFVIDTAFYLKPKIKDLDIKYAYYQLLTQNINKMDSGSAIPSTSREDFYNLELALPPLSVQRRIAAILSSLDEKIELSRQTNQTLEAIAQALFKEWFVEFNFPGATGEMQESELGEIPKGWKIRKLGDEGEFKNGINYSRDENGDTEYSIINVRDVVCNKFLSKSVLDTIRVDEKKAASYLLKADDIIIVRSASPGESAILLYQEENIIYSGFTIRFRLINKRYFLYYFFIFQNLKKALDNLSNGTTLKNINQEMLKTYSVLVPGEKAISSFNKIIEPLFEMILSNNQQIQTLIQLRDTLLPRLMKGEIPITETEKLAAAV